MAKRHTTNPNSLEDLYIRLEELLIASSGEDEFEELLKILSLKLWHDISEEKTNLFLENDNSIEQISRTLRLLSSVWPGVLTEAEVRISNEQLRACLELLGKVNIINYGFEAIDALFEYIVSRKMKGSKGQFFTPRYIVNHCVNLAKPKNSETIIDPAAGSGAFLYHANRYIHSKLDVGYIGVNSNLFAFDFDDRAVRICKLLMYVSKIDNLKVYRVNSLITSKSQMSLFNSKSDDSIMTIEDYLRLNKLETKVDLILTNPPFAGEINEKELLENYEVAQGKQRVERDILFIERCIDLLKPGGRMVIILPDSVFGSLDNTSLREWIHGKARIVGVIGLPRNTFMPHTPVKTSILLIKKRLRRTITNEDIFFGISEQAGKNSRGVLQFESGKETTMENVRHDLKHIENEFYDFISDDRDRWV